MKTPDLARMFKLFPIFVGVAIFAVWGIMLERKSLSKDDDAQGVEIQGQHENEAERIDEAITAGVRAVRGKGQAVAGAVKPLKLRYEAELRAFAKLKASAALNREERARKKSLITNVALIQEVGDLLNFAGQPLRATGLSELQNMAIELLFEARQSTAMAEAERVLRSVIEDEQVEDSELNADVRRSLAGVKAEVLYHWSVKDPSRLGELKSWLPGSVSQKIWRGVMLAQNQNRLASADVSSHVKY